MPLSIVIASHQRCGPLERLLQAIARELEPADASDTEVVVVLDGSRDGSSRMLANIRLPVPLRVHPQAHLGLAAARNAGIEVAAHGVALFFDDDVVPAGGCIDAHRARHADGEAKVVVGPYPMAVAARTWVRRDAWWQQRYGALSQSRSIEEATDISFANTSASVAALRSVGAFDASFQGWGYEDVDVGLRLLRARIPVYFAPEALAWHWQRVGLWDVLRRAREEGGNLALLYRLHPEADFLPARPSARQIAVARHPFLRRALSSLSWTLGLVAAPTRVIDAGMADRLAFSAMRIQRRLGFAESFAADYEAETGRSRRA